MSGSDAVSEAIGEGNESPVPDGVTSIMETLAPSVANRFGSGNFAVVAGGVSLFRAVRSYRKGDRKRALLRAVVGLFWVAVAVAQRRGRSDSGPDVSEVADTSPDVEEAVDPGERDTDHATGSEVVNTTDADIEESDTASELDSDRSDTDVDQRDVAGTDEIEAAEGDDESGMGSDSETNGEAVSADEDSEMEFESDAGLETDDTETGEDAESESAE